ncbi:L-serine ammonia-lyase [Robbsia sp. Bb-Pol-6]|uniref:L-serine ammonia-lyase n=1 Tax=Robbsia betulipollinis TaxID=2981849 RepID=A0ABT3ZS98_9BURK|nr:L-serine ammonia-lyase [Robbsia betulipollinis]MCY0389147.1 L-serine ammonia-lyase [Robbsia betulipollinis]
MAVSVFDLFKIGIGPSSSHTVGPMRAALLFVEALARAGRLEQVASVKVGLYGSLGATGRGHGTDRGVMLGLMGEAPDTIDATSIDARLLTVTQTCRLALLGRHTIDFKPRDQIGFYRQALPAHPNALTLSARDAAGAIVRETTYLSVGGGFVVPLAAGGAAEARGGADEAETAGADVAGADAAEAGATSGVTAPGTGGLLKLPLPPAPAAPFPFRSGAQMLDMARTSGLSIAQMMWANEQVARTDARIHEELARIWQVMQECVVQGCTASAPAARHAVDDGQPMAVPGLTLPGPLHVRRRAPELYRNLSARSASGQVDPLSSIDWLNLFAIAVNEQNAAGGRVVTAPTNGAAGIIPAVLHYYTRFVPDANPAGVETFLLSAAAIGLLYKLNASISGAEVGCQGEVGVACSMAAAGLTAVMGGTPEQVEYAAEIGMEHNLGLTCDPVGGRVQIPCIERNAMGAVKALNASRMALQSDGDHYVSLDSVIKTMRETGADMKTKYKETSRGGLAVNITEC